MHFTKIGTGITTLTKKGTQAIVLDLDQNALKNMKPEDFAKKIYLFKKQNVSNEDYYDVMCPMPNEYSIDYTQKAKQWAQSFKQKHQNTNFQEWLDK